jgi:alpha-beta hydrolase superfamily lysophospholipase
VKWWSFNKSIAVVLSAFFLLSLIVFSVSYYALHEFTFTRYYVLYGKKQSDLAAEIRTELLKRKDIQDVSFFSNGGIKISGFLVKREHATANLLLCHGYKGSKEFIYGYIDMFPNFNILLFDFRAHGQSYGDVISIGCHEYKDVITAAHYLKDVTRLPGGTTLPMIILGISMGGACALKAQETVPTLADVLIVDSTYSDLRKALLRAFSLKSGLPYYPFFHVLKWMFQYFGQCDINEMNTVECSKRIKIPVLFIHACNDSFTSPSNSVRLYANSGCKSSKLWVGPCCRHGWLHMYCPELYKSKVVKFLKKVLPAVNV